MTDPHSGQPVYAAGQKLADANAAMIVLHGRGAPAQDVLSLAPLLPHPQMAYLAPQAAGFTWYPQSFLAPVAANEPGLSSALSVIAALVAEVEAHGIPPERIVLGGFSQGACLAAEFAVRHPRRYGGLLIFSGGVIGPPGTAWDPAPALAETPVFIGCSDVDFHIPVARVHETASVLEASGAQVTKRIYPNMGHTIIQDEIDAAAALVAAV